jgi:hypothetical protein
MISKYYILNMSLDSTVVGAKELFAKKLAIINYTIVHVTLDLKQF